MAHFNRINPEYSRREHPLFRRWTGIRQILLNPHCLDYNPKLRCQGLDDFDEFVEFIEQEIGTKFRRGMMINRINQKKGWVRGNIRWANQTEVGNNRRNNTRLTWQGQTLTIKEWSRHTGIDYACIIRRCQLGWRVKDILTLPSNPRNRYHAGKSA